MPSFMSGKNDILIIAVLLLAAAAAWMVYERFHAPVNPGEIYAEITRTGFDAQRVSLSEDKTFSPEELPNVVFEVKNHKIAFTQSDCPDKICVKTGWLDEAGHFAACMPNHVALRIVSEGEVGADGVDGVAR